MKRQILESFYARGWFSCLERNHQMVLQLTIADSIPADVPINIKKF